MIKLIHLGSPFLQNDVAAEDDDEDDDDGDEDFGDGHRGGHQTMRRSGSKFLGLVATVDSDEGN